MVVGYGTKQKKRNLLIETFEFVVLGKHRATNAEIISSTIGLGYLVGYEIPVIRVHFQGAKFSWANLQLIFCNSKVMPFLRLGRIAHEIWQSSVVTDQLSSASTFTLAAQTPVFSKTHAIY